MHLSDPRPGGIANLQSALLRLDDNRFVVLHSHNPRRIASWDDNEVVGLHVERIE
jgi:predicted MPP superfamily phosphohydrolase